MFREFIAFYTANCTQILWNSDKQIADQIAKLNQDYGEKNILWTLRGTTRTISTEWFDHAGPGTTEQTAMKSALRQGGKGDLNVYTVGFVASRHRISLFSHHMKQVHQCQRTPWLRDIPLVLQRRPQG
jgi:hypothetical protein